MKRDLRPLFLSIIILIVVLAFASLTLKQEVPEETPTIETIKPVTNISFYGVRLNVPAVDEKGNGVTTSLIVEARKGSGRVMVDINQLLFWVDTQNSIRVAQRVAQDYTDSDLSDVDLVYSIETNASVIGGPSAGAALTLATIAVIENRTLDPKVMITGTINSDGTIGPVGEIVAKAKAAKDIGATMFLVPTGQALQTIYTPINHCEKFGLITYCTTEYKAEEINVSKDAGIEVREVKNIEEALEYFLVS